MGDFFKLRGKRGMVLRKGIQLWNHRFAFKSYHRVRKRCFWFKEIYMVEMLRRNKYIQVCFSQLTMSGEVGETERNFWRSKVIFPSHPARYRSSLGYNFCFISFVITVLDQPGVSRIFKNLKKISREIVLLLAWK